MCIEHDIVANSTLTLGIPADRNLDWTEQILSRLESPSAKVEVLIARWVENPLTAQDQQRLNKYFPTKEVLSQARHAPAMRNAIIWAAESTHLLFLDDDMIPEQNLLSAALRLAKCEPDTVYQGLPYRVANYNNWLARAEGKLYERGYGRYVDEQGNVSLLDARLMLAPLEVLRKTPFDESLVFGGGEGRELAKALKEKGVALRLGQGLDAAHINRDTIRSVVEQKLAHGRGRGYQLLHDGPGEKSWLAYIGVYTRRHFLEPVFDKVRGKLDTEELFYIWGTNTIFWLGVIEQMVRSSIRSKVELTKL